MGKYLNFEDEKCEKGYGPFSISKDNFKANIGKTICFVDRVDKYRGYYTVKYGTIYGVRYSQLLLDEGERQVDIRDIKECGIKLED
jgi:hypothetical protein